jgi:ParB/RepB/Spo0J family partition protein
MPRTLARARTTAPDDETDAVFRELPQTALRESPTNPRRVVEDDAFRDLVESVRAHGIIEPLVVRPLEPTDGWEVVAGHRRLRAARAAGIDVVPVMVRNLDDRAVLELALAENVHRASMTPLEEARALQRLAELDGIYRDPRTLAGKIGRSESYVRDRLRLLRLTSEVQVALEAGAITATHAERIARVPAGEQRAALEHCFSGFLLDDTKLRDDMVTVGDAIDQQGWAALAMALLSVGDLDRYLARHATIDVTAPEVQQVLRPDLEELFTNPDRPDDPDADDLAVEDGQYVVATEELPRLSTDTLLRPKEAAALGVLPCMRWKRLDADAKDCGHQQTGIIVHGELDDGSPRTKPELVTFCASAKCARHWPKAKRAKSDRESRKDAEATWEREWQQREAEAAAWKSDLAELRPLVAAKTAGVTCTARLVEHAIDSRDIQHVEQEYGVTLSDATAPQVLALAGLDEWSRDGFVMTAKRLGFDVKVALKTIAEIRRKREGVAAKAAKKTGGRK